MIKAIFADLDGTFLLDKEDNGKVISSKIENIKAIENLQKQGIKFFPISGRTKPSIDNVLAEVNYDYCISQHGTIISKGDEIVWKATINSNDAVGMYELFNEHKISYMVEMGEHAHLHNYDYLTEHQEKHLEEFGAKRSNLNKNFFADNEIISVSTSINTIHPHIENFEQLVKDILGDKFEVFQAGGQSVDVISAESSKGKGALKVANLLGFEDNEIATIGDNLNDLSMIKVTPHSFAMNSGHETLKNHANYNVDSVAEACEIILNYNSDFVK